MLERLLEDAGQDAAVVELVDAACRGEAALDEALDTSAAGARPAHPEPLTVAAPVEPPGAYLQRIQVAGFRGISAPATLQLEPGPGLTLVLGHNGSGKSTFAEGFETLLTGESGRWEKQQQKAWKDGRSWKGIVDSSASLRVPLASDGGNRGSSTNAGTEVPVPAAAVVSGREAFVAGLLSRRSGRAPCRRCWRCRPGRSR